MKTQTTATEPTRTEKACDMLEAISVGGMCATICDLVGRLVLMFF